MFVALAKKIFNFSSLTVRLVVLVNALLIVGGVGQIFLFGSYMRNDMVAVSSSQLQAMAHHVAEDIDRDIICRRDFLQALASHAPRQMPVDASAWRAWVGGFLGIGNLFPGGIRLVDESGRLLARDPTFPEPVDDLPVDADLIARAIQNGFAADLPGKGEQVSAPVLEMAVPIRDQGGQVRGLLIGMTPLRSSSFFGAFTSTRIGKTGDLILVSSRDDVLMTASETDVVLHPLPLKSRDSLYGKGVTPSQGVGIDMRADGVRELAATAAVPTLGWSVVARVPTREIFASVDYLESFILQTALAACVVISVFLVFSVRHLLRHLRYAASHADQMTLAKIPFESLPVARDDEVGHLTKAFNRLLATLLASRADLDYLAHHDDLTGVANRKQFNDSLDGYLARARRQGKGLALLYLDLDGFKPINDSFGHEAGDEVLRHVARRLAKVTRKGDLLARFGGDEFVLLISDLHDIAAEAALVARKCETALVSPISYKGHNLHVGLSIGIARFPIDGQTAEELLARADHAMYRAKRGKVRLA
ncbi:sensor domain-containing diguanylate cyclase [Telmatospirillum siberiense]|nr:sensor domain-containing diguanylate cyclase [Telmatospirillum siberiense]